MILNHLTAKKIVKKYRNVARKKPCQRPDKEVEEEVIFLQRYLFIHGIDYEGTLGTNSMILKQ